MPSEGIDDRAYASADMETCPSLPRELHASFPPDECRSMSKFGPADDEMRRNDPVSKRLANSSQSHQLLADA